MSIRRDGANHRVSLESLVVASQTAAFLVVRNDTLLVEWYGAGMGSESLHTSFSVSKSILSLAVGLAVDSGRLTIADSVGRFVPEAARRDRRLGSITLHHLLTMSSGLAFNRSKTPWGDQAKTYYGANLREVAAGARTVEPPGQRFHYNNYNPLLVGLMLERATGEGLSRALERGIWQRIGAEFDASWSLDGRESGFEKMESGFNATARDFARIGLLVLNRGRALGQQVISGDWIDRSTAADSTTDPAGRYQFFWWLGQPRGGRPTIFAEGRFGQFIWISPAERLVMVRFGATDGGLPWPAFFARVANALQEGNRGTREQGNKGAGEQGNRGTREQGNKGIREQGNKGTREQVNR